MSFSIVLLQLSATLIASFSFTIIFHIKGWNMLFAAIGGAAGWSVYLISSLFVPSLFLAYLAAGFFISIYCEALARIRRSPVTVFLVVSLIPLVPGADAYRIMERCIQGQYTAALESCARMFGIAGMIAMGIFIASSLIRLIPIMYPHKHKK